MEADIFHHYTETATGLTAEYKSVIGFGTAEVVYDDEAIKGLNLICSHCGYHDHIYDTAVLSHTYK